MKQHDFPFLSYFLHSFIIGLITLYLTQGNFYKNSNIRYMAQFLEHIRTHFNVIHQGDYLSLTLINPNISADVMRDIRDKFKLMGTIRRQQIIILQTVNFDDQLLVILAQSLPPGLIQLSLDFTGCESLKGSGFLDLFQKISALENLKKLHLDFSEVYDINDFVVQGLSMLLETLSGLNDFYLDLYEVDQITEDGYLMLAQSLSHLGNLSKLHIDLSANPNLTEDALQLMFSAFPSELTYLGFRILDIEHIGGGSFFKLAESISQMKKLNQLNLTISTFLNINHKGLYTIVKSIGQISCLEILTLNFSNINLPEKMLSYFNFSKNLKNLNLDVSCNPNLSDRDLVCLTLKIPVQNKIKYFSINFDFCKRISEQAIQSLLQRLFSNKSLLKVSLSDRKYSPQFLKSTSQMIQKSGCNKSLISFTCGINIDLSKQKELLSYRIYKDKQKLKRNVILASMSIRKNKLLENYQKDLIQLFLP